MKPSQIVGEAVHGTEVQGDLSIGSLTSPSTPSRLCGGPKAAASVAERE
jgi:hypothetical protein